MFNTICLHSIPKKIVMAELLVFNAATRLPHTTLHGNRRGSPFVLPESCYRISHCRYGFDSSLTLAAFSRKWRIMVERRQFLGNGLQQMCVKRKISE